ncbi:MAG TPA: DUF1049 domain-containing protein [Elainellaceae cyanobacterium]
MKTIGTVLIALILAGWVVAIAIFSIQNVFITGEDGTNQLVSLRFLNASSIEMPLGVALAFCLALGIIGAAIAIPIWNATGSPPYDDDDDDF